MSLSVVFTPEAEDQLLDLHRYIAAAGSTEVAARYAESIVAFCEDLGAFPHRGRGVMTSGQVFAQSALSVESSLPSPCWARLW